MDYAERAAAAVCGDAAAFTSLIEERKNYLYRIAFMYAKNEQDALDILSETIYKAYISKGKLREPKAFHKWITRILVNCSINSNRRHKGVLSLNEEIEVNSMVYEKNNEEYLDLYQAIDRLKGNFKTVVILRYFEGMTINEISGVLECPEGTVKSHLHRAIKKLRIDMEEV